MITMKSDVFATRVGLNMTWFYVFLVKIVCQFVTFFNRICNDDCVKGLLYMHVRVKVPGKLTACLARGYMLLFRNRTIVHVCMHYNLCSKEQ